MTISIEYVYVEMVLSHIEAKVRNKSDKYEIISGLLQGIKTNNIGCFGPGTFVLLSGEKDATNIVNLKFYDIMTVEVRHREHKDITYLTTKNSDQQHALTLLDSLYKDLLENGFGQNGEKDLVNISKYVNVPKEYYNGTAMNLNSTIPDAQHNRANNFHEHYDRNGVGNFANTNALDHPATQTTLLNKKKEIVPGIFNRTKTKKPSKNHLLLMREKIDQINSGEFECNLPEGFENLNADPETARNLYNEGDAY